MTFLKITLLYILASILKTLNKAKECRQKYCAAL